MNDFVVLDIETTGEYPWMHDLVAVGIGQEVLSPDAGMDACSALLETDSIIVAHTNYDLRWMILNGCPLDAANWHFHDTKVMAFMLDQQQELGLSALVQKYLGRPAMHKPIKQVQGRIMYDCSKAVLEKYRDCGLAPIEDVPWDEMVAYNGQDLGETADLYQCLRQELMDRDMWFRYFIAEEAPLSRILIEMEVTGMPIEPEGALDFLTRADEERQRLDKELSRETGCINFNLRSGDQVAGFLYDELPTFKVQVELPGLDALRGPKFKEARERLVADMLPDTFTPDRIGTKFVYGHQTVEGLGLVPPKIKKKKGKVPKRPPIDAENLVLMHGDNAWVQKYLRWKSLNTLCTNYLEKWVAVEHNGRLHGRFDQARAETGRLASRDPNLQAIPVAMGFDVRKLFAAPLMIGDYSGLDARVAAHFSEDPLMLEIYRNNLDLYGTLASEAWGGPADKSNPNRSLMKILMLSAQYGSQAGAIGDKIRISGLGDEVARKAGKLLRNMEETLARMFEWREEVLRDALAHGYIETITGRKRYLPDLYSDDWSRRTRAERQCVASMVQGTSADIVRRAMLAVRRAVPMEEAKIVLQVHDEILWERGPAWTGDSFDKIVDICQTAHEKDFYVPETGETLPGFPLNIPMKFDAGLGDSWEEKDAAGARSYRVMSKEA